MSNTEGYFKHDTDYASLLEIEGNEIGVCEIQGRRPSQEDSLIVSVEEVKNFIYLSLENRKQALINTFAELQEKYGQAENSGSTGCVTIAWLEKLKTYRNRCKLVIYTVNIGDSTAYRIVINDKGKSNTIRLNKYLHNPDRAFEKERLESQHYPAYYYRLTSGLAVSRLFGDTDSERYGLIHDPDIYHDEIILPEKNKNYVVIACDGLTEAGILNEQSIGMQITEAVLENRDLSDIAENLVMTAYAAGSGDNISVGLFKVTKKPVSVGIFDGHGGNTVSKALGENCYKVLLKHINKLI